jgi:hypothetical protein
MQHHNNAYTPYTMLDALARMFWSLDLHQPVGLKHPSVVVKCILTMLYMLKN